MLEQGGVTFLVGRLYSIQNTLKGLCLAMAAGQETSAYQS